MMRLLLVRCTRTTLFLWTGPQDRFTAARPSRNSTQTCSSRWQPKNHTSTTDLHSGRMLGPDNLTRAGVWSETGKGKNGEDVPIKGYWSEIDTREGDAWKICVLTGNITPDSWALIYKSFGLPPAATPSPSFSKRLATREPVHPQTLAEKPGWLVRPRRASARYSTRTWCCPAMPPQRCPFRLDSPATSTRAKRTTAPRARGSI
jgi:hypothetical protein